ncbi:MAG: STAS domain-containing protein [Burkholderiales bacterium]|nr:STAS domain-containing protein [Burkholderiales bacterium]
MRLDGERVLLEGPVNIETAPALFAQARATCRDGATLLDFAAVGEVDSAAVAMVVALLRDAEAAGRRLALANVPAAMATLAELYSVADVIAPPRP